MNSVKSLKSVRPEVMDHVVNDVWHQLRQCLISEHAEDKVVLQIWNKVDDKV